MDERGTEGFGMDGLRGIRRRRWVMGLTRFIEEVKGVR